MNIHEMKANAVTQLYNERKEEQVRKINKELKTLSTTDLNDVKWLWPATLKTLIEGWITTKEDLKETWIDKIKSIVTNPMSLKGIINFLKN